MHTAEKYYKAAGHENFSLNILNVIEEDVQTKLSTVLSSGATDELPDIVLMGDSWANMYLTNFPGCYADLTDEIDFSEFAQYKVSCFTVDGRVYGIPSTAAPPVCSTAPTFLSRLATPLRISRISPGGIWSRLARPSTRRPASTRFPSTPPTAAPLPIWTA